ncbi:toxin-antitoxin system HicB family antitoxin [Actinomadura violacea]|uniref:Toxin-antitoxin system HicB family antitoxin n=1 Tax=Actinomadura violacea TaxID=2819934 RepID=A0ABS3RW18_9ACTN|nr:toxin-antitoxin system HicB family antitoxin [Actinomadura violacea]MBO2460933.1 toxin-antitoxin system HicB family antitoxin [Actinomadura violacea]
MDLMPYVESLRRELAVAAEAGGPEARALAERLTGVLESATRLTLLEALSAAADEITRDLAPGSVDVRLRGGDPAFVVTPPQPGPPTSEDAAAPPEPAPEPASEAVPTAAAPSGEEGGTARMTLRLPEHLKLRVEEAAGRQGISVNAWLVRAISAAFEPGAGPRSPAPGRAAQQAHGGRSYTGWVR